MIFINTEKIESEIKRESGKNRTRFYQNGDIKRQTNREERRVKEKKTSKKEKKCIISLIFVKERNQKVFLSRGIIFPYSSMGSEWRNSCRMW